MKKFILGGLLFTMGTLGVIAMIVAGINAAGPFERYLSMYESWFAAILARGALAPLIVFCLMCIAGLVLCGFSALREDKKPKL